MSFLLVSSAFGVRETELLPDLQSLSQRLWPLVRDGARIEGVSADGRWLSRGELFEVLERVIAAAPRPIPACAANALMDLLPWAERRARMALAGPARAV
jgi:hypothetical protein